MSNIPNEPNSINLQQTDYENQSVGYKKAMLKATQQTAYWTYKLYGLIESQHASLNQIIESSTRHLLEGLTRRVDRRIEIDGFTASTNGQQYTINSKGYTSITVIAHSGSFKLKTGSQNTELHPNDQFKIDINTGNGEFANNIIARAGAAGSQLAVIKVK